MDIVSRIDARGGDIGLLTTDKLHFNEKGQVPSEKKQSAGPFAQVLFNAIDQTDDLQSNSDNLEEKMIINPESVNVDEVMIASEKARLSVSFFKSITEKAIRAYNDIMMIR